MSQFTSAEFLKSFLDEADEYLQTILDCLLALEKPFQEGAAHRGRRVASARAADGDETLSMLNELLRTLHSLKGISAMVGLNPAAELCHAMESALKPIQQGQRDLEADVLNQLIEAAKLLETVVQTVRDSALAMPDIQEEVARLAAYVPTASPADSAQKAPPQEDSATPPPAGSAAFPEEVAAHLREPEWRKINAALAAGSQIALVYYVPTAQQVQEGKNVNHVREQLKTAAELIKAMPIIQEGGVRFAFLVSCAAIPAAPELAHLDWRPIAMVGQAEHQAHEKAPDAPVGASAPIGQLAPTASIRVDLSRMDELMRLVGDLVVTRSRISEALPKLDGAAPIVLENLGETAAKMERQVRNLREAVMRVRLVPLAEVFSRMPLAVRDLARTTGKNVQLTVEGGDTEIDKALVDRLVDPLLHTVRNAVTHGIETPDQRAAAGKPAEGVIRLRGRTEGDHVIITVEDDGGGIAVERVRAKARALGWLDDDHPLSNQDLLEILCRPGFSTQESADMGAGRGMGMNAAAAAIAEMGGKFALDTQPGRGAVFTIQLPLTLTIIDAFIVEAGGERYAVPQGIVNEVIEVVPGEITHVMKHDLLPYRGGTLPLLSLGRAFSLPESAVERRLGLVVGQAERQAAILVDRVLGVRETVVRPLSDPLVAEPGISGATELGDGSVVLILDCSELLSHYKATR